MAIVVVGLNHMTAPVAVRERLAFSDATLTQAANSLRDETVKLQAAASDLRSQLKC